MGATVRALGQKCKLPRGQFMRRLALLLAALIVTLMTHAAHASLAVRIDKSSQRMTVAVDGHTAYVWAVSTGRGGYGTPTGRFRPRWLARSWFSTRYYGSPMPHSIFFHKGYAIHGTYHISRLGGPASHGCVRLHPGAAATLFALVRRHGMSNTSIMITGGNPRGIARGRARTAQAGY
jgi:hypothetical protein